MLLSAYYFNDEQRPMRVRVMDNMYSPFTGTGDHYVTLAPAEGRLFELQVPDSHVLYVKKWKDLVMISHIDPAVLAQPAQRLPTKGDA